MIALNFYMQRNMSVQIVFCDITLNVEGISTGRNLHPRRVAAYSSRSDCYDSPGLLGGVGVEGLDEAQGVHQSSIRGMALLRYPVVT
jgi:hypothetical protein